MTDDTSFNTETPVVEEKKTSIYDYFKTDTSKESRGIEVDYGSAGIFTIARAGGSNKAFTKKVEQLMRPYRRFLKTGDITKIPEGVLEEVTRTAFIENILLGWSGVRDENGNVLQYSRSNAEKLFKDLPDLLNDLQGVAADHTAFLQSEMEDDAKN